MSKITLSIIAMLLFANAFAQTAKQRYPFKKATITYTLSGDYQGTRTIYIDNFGAKQADYWKGSYEKRQPGPNERIDFEFHDIFIGKLKYQINDAEYSALVSSNPYYFYAKDTEDMQAANDAILKAEQFEKTEQVEQLGDDQCTVWLQHIRFMIEIDNYIWLNDKNIVCKYKFGFLTQLQKMGSMGTATIEKIDFESDIPEAIFNDFPEFFVYQYMERSDHEGNSFDDQVFASEEGKTKFEEELKLKGFVSDRDIKVEEFKKTIQEFSNLFLGEMNSSGYGDGSLTSMIMIKEQTDSTNEVLLSFEIRTRQNLDKLYLDDFKRSFNHFNTINYQKIEIDGTPAFYLYGTTTDDDENQPKSVIALNNKDKYSIKLVAYGKYSQEEMVKMLKNSKILDL